MMKKVLLVLIFIICASVFYAQSTTDTISDGTNNSSNSSAMPGFYGRHFSACLYTASELNSHAGTLKSISYHIYTGNTAYWEDQRVKIYLKETTAAAVDETQNWAEVKEGATMVYDSTSFDLQYDDYWKNFDFTEGFAYNGENILVIVEGYSANTNGGDEIEIYTNYDNTGKCFIYMLDNAEPASNIALSAMDDEQGQIERNERPDIFFTYDDNAVSDVCIKNLPYTEDYEGLDTYSNTSFPECWSKIFSYQSGMEYDCPTISPTGADGSSGSLFFMLQGPTSQFAISPKIDPTVPISNTTVKLRYKSTKTTEVGLILGVMSDPTDTLTFVAIDTIHRVGATSTWELKEINMAAYSGEGHYIALWLCGRACSAAYPSCFVDNFAVEMSASCTAPVQIAASVNNDEATISWTPTDNTTAVRLYYKDSDEETYQSVDISAGTNQYTIEGLSLATNYEYYLVTICGDDESQPSATATFSTPCEEITEFPWTEDFENGLMCWSLDGSANAVNWTISTNPANPSCAPASGSNVATFAAFNFTDGSWATMTSPAIDLTESRALTFKLYQYGPMEDYFSEQPYDDKIEIYVNDDPSVDDATLIATVNGYSSAEGWQEYTFAIPQQTSSRSYITLKGISNYGYNLHIDDLSIENTTEIEEGSNTTLSIYPNPAHDYATLNINGLESVSEIILTDMCGKVVRTYIVNKGDNEILIEKGNLSAGIYVIRLTSGEKTIVEKVTFQ